MIKKHDDTNDNLGIGIMSSINLQERYTMCLNTWTRDFDNVYIFGGNSANEKDKRLISIESAGEDWKSCFLKQQLGLEYMYNDNPNYEWYSIFGCDNVLYKNHALRELSKYNASDDIILSQVNRW